MTETRTSREKPRCIAYVWVKDCYRRTGRGKTGFEMHYNKQQCARRITLKNGLCWQHAKLRSEGVNFSVLEERWR